MWPVLTILACVLALVLHVLWLSRYRRLTREFAQEQQRRADLERSHELSSSHKQAEQHTLFNNMVEGVLILDGSGRIQMANRSLKQILAVEGDIRGRTVQEAFGLSALADVIEKLREQPSVQGLELELPGIEPRHLQLTAATVLNNQSAPQAWLVVFHDLTRIRHLENTRQEFVANVSHELRTPLSLIKGYVETLLDGAKDNPEETAAFLRTIEKHTNRLAFLIEDLLTISRLESGQIVMNLNPVQLREEAQQTAEALQAAAAEKGSSIDNLIPEGLICQADADRLQQVLFNLIENAIKYGRDKGAVTLGARRVADGKIEVFITDDGPGIPAEARERVFERFYRADRARSRETGGTGLGLSIVKHIVQAHGGDVWVKSGLEKGTTFFFTVLEA